MERAGFQRGGFGGGALGPEIGESADDVGLEFRQRWTFGESCASRNAGDGDVEFVAKFHHHALGRLFADTGDARQLSYITLADCADQIRCGDAGECLDGHRGTDAADGDESLEQKLFVRSGETVQHEGVFPDVRMDAEFGLLAGVRQLHERRNGDVDFIAHAAGFDDDLLRMFFEHGSAEVGNHRKLTFYMARRLFFVPEVRREEAELTGEAAQHLVRVLRVEAGETYEISDNRKRYLAEVVSARKSSVVFRILERVGAGEPVPEVTLLASLFKFDHFEWMLEKATELNVARIVPVVSVRSERGLAQAAEKRMERWRRILLESSQQSRRTVLPEMEEALAFGQALRFEAAHRWILDEDRQGAVLAGMRVAAGDSAALLVGPEGGWTDEERAAARAAAWTPVTVGLNVLRAETAAMAGLATVGQLYSLASTA